MELIFLEEGLRASFAEVCFCSNPEDGKRYITNFEQLAQAIARTLAENIVIKE